MVLEVQTSSSQLAPPKLFEGGKKRLTTNGVRKCKDCIFIATSPQMLDIIEQENEILKKRKMTNIS